MMSSLRGYLITIPDETLRGETNDILWGYINTLYNLEIDYRITTDEIVSEIDRNFEFFAYAEKRPTCLLDQLKEAWFTYTRYIENLSIRAATSEVAIGSISTELSSAEWLSAINEVQKSIHNGILMLNSDGSDLKFVSRDFSGAQELTTVFLQNFLFVSGLPEDVLFGTSFSSAGFSDATKSDIYYINLEAELLAMKWIAFEEELQLLYQFSDFGNVMIAPATSVDKPRFARGGSVP